MRLKKITKAQLAKIAKCYSDVFPDWEFLDGSRLVRICFPIIQQIGFEATSSGSYRPATQIRALPLPTIRMLPQFLDAKHCQIHLREHLSKWESVVTAMEQQFLPSIRKPMDLREIEKLCEQAAHEKTKDYSMLAILNAWLGEREKAILYCQRVQTVPPLRPDPRPEWELEQQDFCRKLHQAIEAGSGRQFLENATSQENR